MIRYANAPCSWGTIEGWGQSIPFGQMLDELKACGYEATELGDYGYMPTDPAQLRQELTARDLTMLAAYEGVRLREPAALEDGLARVLRTARLLKAVADVGDPNWQPYLVLADEHSLDPMRFQNAGNLNASMGLTPDGFKTFAGAANQVARQVFDETGLKTVFHHHCSGYVETPDEVSRLLELTDPKLLGLVYDTGHALFGSASNDPDVVLRSMDEFRERIWYVHFKDCDGAIASQSRREGWNYKQSVGAGVFCELGQGLVPFEAVLEKLRAWGYQGWITVEQDVLPGMGEPRLSAKRNREFIAGLG